jgi:4-hydroxybenzoate polyprenyltransferase
LGSFKLLAVLINIFHIKNFPPLQGQIDEILIACCDLIFCSIFALIWLWRYSPVSCKAIIKNIRPTRTLHYILLCSAGMLVQCVHIPLYDPFALIRILCAWMAIFFAFQFSVITNDIYDIDADKISNASRPLVTQTVKIPQYLTIDFVTLALSLLFSYWVGERFCMIMLLFIAVYFIYSVPPLRLKRFFPLSCLLIGLQALLAFMAGEHCLERTNIFVYPSYGLQWLIFIAFTLSSNIKDLKDIAGDKLTKIPTLPTLLGEETGRRLIAFLVFISYCLTPVFVAATFPKASIFVISVVCGLISLFYIRRKNAQEKVIFLFYFIYIIFVTLAIKGSLN